TVTGSSSGLGRAIAIRYAQEGAKVVCADLTPTARSQEEAEITTHDLILRDGGQATFVKTDVGDATQMELVQVAVEEYGRLDILVNNAGISIEARTPAVLHLTDETTWEYHDACQHQVCIPRLQVCSYSNVSARTSFFRRSGLDRQYLFHYGYDRWAGESWLASYCASKGAVSNLTRQIALDYAPDNIHINAICPGYTQTAIF
ncbi:hypothetical protein N7501_008512, partial [Penicillium viridicatum]